MIPLSLSPALGLLPPRRRRRRRSRKAVARWQLPARWAWRRLNAAPRPLRLAVIAAALLALIAATNTAYQVVRRRCSSP